MASGTFSSGWSPRPRWPRRPPWSFSWSRTPSRPIRSWPSSATSSRAIPRPSRASGRAGASTGPSTSSTGSFSPGSARGDMGESIASHRPVLDDIRQYVPATIELATAAGLLTILCRGAARRCRGRAAGRVRRPRGPPPLPHRRVGADVLARVHRAGALLRRPRDRALAGTAGRGRRRAAARHGPVRRRRGAGAGLGDGQERPRPSGSPGGGSGGGHDRHRHPDHAGGHAGDAGPGLRADGPGQGRDGARRRAAPRVPERAAPDPDAGGPRVRGAPGGHGPDGDDLSWPGLGRYTYQSALAIDFPAIMGVTFLVALDVSGDQPARGHRLSFVDPRAARS